jgi:hypothetical protein
MKLSHSVKLVLLMLLAGARLSVAGPEDGSMARLIEAAAADLVGRLSVDKSRVEVVKVEAVTWPNPSLGCPHQGMEYRQIPVDGYRIVLRVAGREYSYHGDGRRGPFYCPQPALQPPRIDPRADR